MSHILRSIFFLCFFLIVAPMEGQSFRAYVRAADRAFAESDHYSAMLHYSEALQRRQEPKVQYQYAEAARRFFALDTAALYYSKVMETAPGDFPLTSYWLGVVRRQQGQYAAAIDMFQRYLQSTQRNKQYAALARGEMEACRWARAQPEVPGVKVQQLSRQVNTAYSEFGPWQQGDTLFYSSLRFDNKYDKHQPPRKISKVLYVKGNSRGRPLRRDFNAADQHTAHSALSADGRRMYFTRCDYVGTTSIRCALFYRDLDSRGRWERTPVKLPATVNLPGYTATQPAAGYDSVRQEEVLFFVSDRPGGKGGMDIWRVKAGPELRDFGEPEPLTGINTTQDELTPFFHNPTQTLYFSSDGYPGFGAYDIFKTGIQTGQEVENLGAPVNTSYNDLYFFLNPDARTGYLSSNRPGSFYLDEASKACCNDLFRVEMTPPDLPPDTSQLVTAPPVPVAPEPPVAEAPPDKLEDFLPLALYFDNDEPDRRTRRTTTRKTYSETFLPYYRRKGEYLDNYATPLPEGRREEAELAVEEFFENEVKQGYDYLNLFSDLLLQRLQEGEEVEVFIRGYTSPRAKSDYNLALGQRRISSLRNHFQRFRGGVFQSYLESGQLVITERSFGETQAASGVSDDLSDERNSIYSPAAARERRVEIEEVERN